MRLPFPTLHKSCLSIAFAALTCPTLAVADGHGTGSFAFVTDAGQTVMALDLVESGGRISGSGVMPDGGLPQGPGVVDVRLGSRVGDGLQFMLELDPHDPALPLANARMSSPDGTAMRLVLNGRVVNGSLQSVAPGSISIAPAPAETTPQVAAPAPAPAPAPEPAPAPQVATIPPSCLQLDQVTAEINATADADVVQEVRSIYTLYGLSFGGEQTDSKCSGALNEITIFLEDMDAGDTAEACYAVESAIVEIDNRLVATGNPPSAEPKQIMAAAGMVVNNTGTNNAQTCGRALPGLYAFLDAITPPATAQVDTFDLPAGYRVEPIVNVNIRGTWSLSAGGERMALWSQGKSRIAYERGPGNARAAWFWEPRPGLVNKGAGVGTLFFEGRREGTTLRGEARHFIEGCGAYVFPVEGRIRDRETAINVTGQRPVVDSECNISGLTEELYRLRFVADNPVGTDNLNTNTGRNGAANTPNFGVWGMTYEIRAIDRGGALNIRRNPSTNARIVGEIPYNARDIAILGEGCTPAIDQVAFEDMTRRQRRTVLNTRWCRIRWQGQTGWVYGRYLRPM